MQSLVRRNVGDPSATIVKPQHRKLHQVKNATRQNIIPCAAKVCESHCSNFCAAIFHFYRRSK